jgi:carbonic anhydrase
MVNDVLGLHPWVWRRPDVCVCVVPVLVLQATLESISDPTEQWNKLVELNVQEQCINLFANPIVQRRQARPHMT